MRMAYSIRIRNIFRLNIIKSYRSLSLLIQIPYPLQLVPVTMIEFWRNGQGFGVDKI